MNFPNPPPHSNKTTSLSAAQRARKTRDLVCQKVYEKIRQFTLAPIQSGYVAGLTRPEIAADPPDQDNDNFMYYGTVDARVNDLRLLGAIKSLPDTRPTHRKHSAHVLVAQNPHITDLASAAAAGTPDRVVPKGEAMQKKNKALRDRVKKLKEENSSLRAKIKELEA